MYKQMIIIFLIELCIISFHFHFIASITYYNVNYLSPLTYFVDTKHVMRESIEKQIKMIESIDHSIGNM